MLTSLFPLPILSVSLWWSWKFAMIINDIYSDMHNWNWDFFFYISYTEHTTQVLIFQLLIILYIYILHIFNSLYQQFYKECNILSVFFSTNISNWLPQTIMTNLHNIASFPCLENSQFALFYVLCVQYSPPLSKKVFPCLILGTFTHSCEMCEILGIYYTCNQLYKCIV